MNSSFPSSAPFSSHSRERLFALIDRLNNEGHLTGPEIQELESILTSDEEAREIYVLHQELDALLLADKSIRLCLASDLLPDNVVVMPGVSPAFLSHPVPSARRNRIHSKTIQSTSLFRSGALLAAAVVGFISLLFIYQRSGDLAEAFLRLGQETPTSAPSQVSYQEDVLPILAEHCFECHGSDESKRKAGLRLDSALLASVGKDAIIVKGAPDQSKLIARVTSDDPDFQMPPPHSGRNRLTNRQIEILGAWIMQGASYELTGQRMRLGPLVAWNCNGHHL